MAVLQINGIRMSRTLAFSTAAVALLTASYAASAQTRPMEGFETQNQVAPKTDWSGQAGTSNEVDSVSQPTRFDVQSSIPDSRTGNEEPIAPKPLRERGGVLLDRLEQGQTPGRATPIVR
ncbi:MAG: hypothetical protein AB8C46_18240 [Burkholderiaceae bacterium]